MRLSLISSSTSEPLTRTETKLHLRVESSVTDDDALIDNLIEAARGHVERITGRQLINATYDAKLDGFPNSSYEIELPRPPLSSITSVSYVDSAGSSQTWASSQYQSDAPSGPTAEAGRLMPAYGITYPSTRIDIYNAVTVRYVAGYGSSSQLENIPEAIRLAMLLTIGHWYEHREAVMVGTITAEMPMSAKALLAPYVWRPQKAWAA